VKRHLGFIVIGVLIFAIIVLYMVMFTVRWQEKALVLTFEKISRQVDQPGLNIKWPWQQTVTFDTRIRTFQQQPVETQTQDKQPLIVSAYVNWRITDPRVFYGSFRRQGRESSEDVVDYARDTIAAWVAEATNVFAEYRLDQLVTLDEAAFKLASIESGSDSKEDPQSQTLGMLERIREKAHADKGYGLEIIDLGIRKLGVPDAVTRAVFDRMREERQAEVVRLQTAGESQASAIKAEAKKQAVFLTSDAKARAKSIKAQGDAEAAEYYAKFLAQPQLANFLRKLETIRKTLTSRSTFVITPDFPGYELLEKGPALMESPLAPAAPVAPITSLSQKDN